MFYSDFKCGCCGHIVRRWEYFAGRAGNVFLNIRCPVFQCIFDNGYDIVYFENGKEKTARLGNSMEFLGCFREVRTVSYERMP